MKPNKTIKKYDHEDDESSSTHRCNSFVVHSFPRVGGCLDEREVVPSDSAGALVHNNPDDRVKKSFHNGQGDIAAIYSIHMYKNGWH